MMGMKDSSQSPTIHEVLIPSGSEGIGEVRDTHRHHGGRLGVENPRRNLIVFKVSDSELAFLDVVERMFGSRSEMIRTVLFDFAFALDPRKVKEHIDPEVFERLKQRLVEESA